VAMIVAEFFGTAVLASVALAMLERTTFPLFLGVAMGTAYTAFWFMFGKSSGAQFNPVLTVAMWTLRKIQTTQALVYIVAQALGGLVAWRLAEFLQRSTLSNISGKNFDWRILIAEAIGTMIFSMGVAAATYNQDDDLKKTITVAGSLLLGVSVAAFASNGLLNPAVAIGVRSFSWSYSVGPLVGALVGMNLYVWLFGPSKHSVRVSASASSTKSAPAKKKPATRGRRTTTRRATSTTRRTTTRRRA